jgi:thioredoxin-related protein
MKNLLIIIFSVAAMSFTGWETDFEKAKQKAKEKHELILLNFSGSDWCGPCMRMKKEVFEDKPFSTMADANLVLVNADFPRSKKNQLSEQIRKQNELLADKYDPEGKFPFTLLLNPDGKILKTWDGLPDENADQFIKQIKAICDANK